MTRRPSARFAELPKAEQADLLRETLARAPDPSAIWVFAFGSLMWHPGFAYGEKRLALLRGYERRFNIWTVLTRGSVDHPGLGLALTPGDGACQGLAYRLPPDGSDAALDALWDREMTTGVYRPRWLPVETAEATVQAVTFVVDPSHPQYVGDLPPDEQAALIATAAGKYGTNRDYLACTVRELERLGVHEPALVDLLARVEALAGGGGG